MTVSSYTPKQLRITLVLDDPNTSFAVTGTNTLVLTGLRCVAVINAVASLSTDADLQIFGMLPTDMNALTVVWFNQPVFLNHTVKIEANSGTGWVEVFFGTMTEAQPDYSSAPDVAFHIQASFGYFAKVSSAAPASYQGPTPVATMAQNVANLLGLAFENNGVNAVLANAYYPGSLWDQLKAMCQAAAIDFYIDGNTLAICPATSPRANVPLVVLNKDSGLINQPVIERNGISIQCLWTPGIVGGGIIEVQGTRIPAANRQWNPYHLTHTLEAVKPGGAWFSELHCTPVLANG